MNEIDIQAGLMIRQRRKELKMTQTQLGDKLGLSTTAICQYETGRRQMDLLIFFKICHILNLSNEEIENRLDHYLKKYI